MGLLKLLTVLIELAAFVVVSLVLGAVVGDHGENIPFAPVWQDIDDAGKHASLISQRLQDLSIDSTATIVGFRWQREIGLERLHYEQATGDALPSDAKLVSQRQVQDGTRQVEDGTEDATRTVQVQTGTTAATRIVKEQVQTGTETYVCGKIDLGNGYFKDKDCTRPVYTTQEKEEHYEEPVYEAHTEHYQRTKYKDVPVFKTLFTYKLPKWEAIAPAVLVGTNHQPQWPVYKQMPTTSDPAPEGLVRETGRKAQYWVKFRTFDGQEAEEQVAVEPWSALPEPGGAVPMKLRAFSRQLPSVVGGN